MSGPKILLFCNACQSYKYLPTKTSFWHKIGTVVYNWTQKTILKSINWNPRYGHIYTHYRIPKYRDGDYDRAEIYTFLNRLSKLQIFVDSNGILTQDKDSCVQLNAKNDFEIDQMKPEIRTYLYALSYTKIPRRRLWSRRNLYVFESLVKAPNICRFKRYFDTR